MELALKNVNFSSDNKAMTRYKNSPFLGNQKLFHDKNKSYDANKINSLLLNRKIYLKISPNLKFLRYIPSTKKNSDSKPKTNRKPRLSPLNPAHTESSLLSFSGSMANLTSKGRNIHLPSSSSSKIHVVSVTKGSYCTQASSPKVIKKDKTSFNKLKLVHSPKAARLIKITSIISPIKIANTEFLENKKEESLPNLEDSVPVKKKIKKTPIKLEPSLIRNYFGRSDGKKENIILIQQSIFNLPNYNIFGIFQGIGHDGYDIANLVKANFMYFLTSEYSYLTSKYEVAVGDIKHINKKLHENEYKLIKSTFEKVAYQLYLSRYNYKNSGCSALLLFCIEKKIICVSFGNLVALSMLYRKEESLESFRSKVLSGEEQNRKIFGCGEYSSFKQPDPLIKEIDLDEYTVDTIFISTNHLVSVIGQSNIIKILSSERNNNIEKITEKIVRLYKKYCQRNNVAKKEASLIIVNY